jgi:hypothetical protein
MELFKTYEDQRDEEAVENICRDFSGSNPVLFPMPFEVHQIRPERWCRAVDNWGKMGNWEFHTAKEPDHFHKELK